MLPHVILLLAASPRMLLVTLVNEPLDSLLSLYPHSLLECMQLAQTVLARVAGLELNEQFE